MASKRVQIRRGSTSDHAAFTGAEGEITYDTTKKVLVAHDGLTAGGFPMNLGSKTLVAPKDGSDASPAIDAWLDDVCANGGTGVIPAGTYTMSSMCQSALSASCEIICSAGARFVAASGFPAGRMFMIITGTGSGHKFKWRGGSFDGTLMPNSLPGQANDIFGFHAENCSRCDIELDETITGTDIGTGGGDSHLFIGGALNVRAHIGRSVGAVDAGIYISSDFTGSVGHSLSATGNFERAQVAVIVKRKFETWKIDINCYECQNGAAGGVADIFGGVFGLPGDGAEIRVNAYRCDRPVSMIGVSGAQITAVIKELGLSTTSFTSTGPRGVYLSGSSHCNVNCVVDQTNPLLTKTAAFVAVDLDRRTVNTTDYDATDNIVIVNADGVGKGYRDDANSARNFVLVKERNVTAASTVLGVNSSMHRSNPSTSGFEMDEPAISLCGTRNAEAVRIIKTANQVNFIQLVGSAAGAGSGVSIQAQGSDATVPLNISSKGASPVLIGAPVGAETIRANKVDNQVNSLEVNASVSGSPVHIRARGADADVDLLVTGQGTGVVRMGTFTISALTSIVGYITIKDASGNTRKLAVMS